MKEFIKENFDKMIMTWLFLLLLFVFVNHSDNKTIENITWLCFGGVLTILGVKKNTQTINADNLENANSNIGETSKENYSAQENNNEGIRTNKI